MAGFLENYEGNKERTDRWIATFPNGRLEAHIIEFNADKGFVLVQAKAWRNQEETEPAGIDYGFGYREAYNPNMKRWFVEDTVTSALMRVMALVMGGTEKATKETMQQVKVNDATKPVEHDYWTTKFGDIPSYKTAAEAEQSGIPSLGSSMEEIAKQLGGELVQEPPQCSHGHRIWKQQAKANVDAGKKNWGGYFCTERDDKKQCAPYWYVLRSTGKWEPQV